MQAQLKGYTEWHFSLFSGKNIISTLDFRTDFMVIMTMTSLVIMLWL